MPRLKPESCQTLRYELGSFERKKLTELLAEQKRFKLSQSSTGFGLAIGGISLGLGVGIAGYFMAELLEDKIEGFTDFAKDSWARFNGDVFNKESKEYEDYSVDKRDYSGSPNEASEEYNPNFGEPTGETIENPITFPLIGGLFSMGMWIGEKTFQGVQNIGKSTEESFENLT